MDLRPYQREIVSSVWQGLRDGGIGQIHMACASGKTIVGQHAAQRLLPAGGGVAVLMPSLTLIAQTLTAWGRNTSQPLDALAVCSDDTVADAAVHVEDLSVPVTTSTEDIVSWLRRPPAPGMRLVLCTYASADRLADAVIATKPLDLVILDEAHHLAGRVDFTTRQILHPGRLPALRRLFMTATPREDLRLRQGNVADGSVPLVGMDDQTVFGPVLGDYPTARGIAEGYLEDYRIAVIGIRDSQARALLAKKGVEYVDAPGTPSLQTVVAQAALGRAREQFGIQQVLTFHPRVEAAAEFSRTLAGTLAHAAPGQQDDLYAAHVHGQMDQRLRERVVGHLRGAAEGWSVVSNARCLGEGVDVPAVDAVLFAHPKKSAVDITQAVGRALRRNPHNPGPATIIVPLIVPDEDGEIGDLEPGDYTTLWQVVRALRAHDETLGTALDVQRSQQSQSNPGLPDKITLLLPPGTSRNFLANLKILLVRQTTSIWWEGPMIGVSSLRKQETPFPHTTDPVELATRVRPLYHVTVFATYASLGLGTLEHAHNAGLPGWDLIIIDEAHRTSGHLGKPWAVIHDNTRIPSLRRLYTTATPRVWQLDDDSGQGAPGELVASMDDDPDGPFGVRCYTLTLSEAIDRGICAPYQVVCVDITDTQLQATQLLGPQSHTDEVRGVRLAALQTALLKASSQEGFRRGLVFHHVVKEAEAFAAGLPQVARRLHSTDPERYPETIWADWLSGGHTPLHRQAVLAQFANPTTTTADGHPAEKAFLGSVKVLGEGIDTKNCDSVYFADVRGSMPDLIQAIGRALRIQPSERKTASLVVPVLLGPGETPDTILTSRAYDGLAKLLQALRAHDARIVEHLAQPQAQSRATSVQTPSEAQDDTARSDRSDRLSPPARALLKFSTPRDPAQLATFIDLRVLNPEHSHWRRGIEAALIYHRLHDDLRVPFTYRVPDAREAQAQGWPATLTTFPLGQWIADARRSHARGDMPAERVEQLEKLGMVWSHFDVVWHEGLDAARGWAKENGTPPGTTRRHLPRLQGGNLAEERTRCRPPAAREPTAGCREPAAEIGTRGALPGATRPTGRHRPFLVPTGPSGMATRLPPHPPPPRGRRHPAHRTGQRPTPGRGPGAMGPSADTPLRRTHRRPAMDVPTRPGHPPRR